MLLSIYNNIHIKRKHCGRLIKTFNDLLSKLKIIFLIYTDLRVLKFVIHYRLKSLHELK